MSENKDFEKLVSSVGFFLQEAVRNIEQMGRDSSLVSAKEYIRLARNSVADFHYKNTAAVNNLDEVFKNVVANFSGKDIVSISKVGQSTIQIKVSEARTLGSFPEEIDGISISVSLV